ncbi:hypothetical protein [Alistipes finegoldii]
MEEQIPLGFIGILLGVFAFAFLIGVGISEATANSTSQKSPERLLSVA